MVSTSRLWRLIVTTFTLPRSMSPATMASACARADFPLAGLSLNASSMILLAWSSRLVPIGPPLRITTLDCFARHSASSALSSCWDWTATPLAGTRTPISAMSVPVNTPSS